MVVDPDVVEV